MPEKLFYTFLILIFPLLGLWAFFGLTGRKHERFIIPLTLGVKTMIISAICWIWN